MSSASYRCSTSSTSSSPCWRKIAHMRMGMLRASASCNTLRIVMQQARSAAPDDPWPVSQSQDTRGGRSFARGVSASRRCRQTPGLSPPGKPSR